MLWIFNHLPQDFATKGKVDQGGVTYLQSSFIDGFFDYVLVCQVLFLIVAPASLPEEISEERGDLIHYISGGEQECCLVNY